MIEVVATPLITVASALLFGYWYRYICLLILSAKTTRDYAGDVAAANQLSFLEVQKQLHAAASADLARLHESLDRDYTVLRFLFRNAACAQGEQTIEHQMLRLDYRMMGIWYQISRHFSAQAARKALEEMTMVVAHMANAMGERCAAAA
jgi:hypothetical protein